MDKNLEAVTEYADVELKQNGGQKEEKIYSSYDKYTPPIETERTENLKGVDLKEKL